MMEHPMTCLSDLKPGDTIEVHHANATYPAKVVEVCPDRLRVDVDLGLVVMRLTFSPDGQRLIGSRIEEVRAVGMEVEVSDA